MRGRSATYSPVLACDGATVCPPVAAAVGGPGGRGGNRAKEYRMILHILLAAALPLSTAVGDTERRFVVVAPAETLAVAVDGGDGRAVVMVPGLLGAAYTFRHVRHALAEAGLRVVVVEPLGTGASSRPKHADYSLTAQSRRIEA